MDSRNNNAQNQRLLNGVKRRNAAAVQAALLAGADPRMRVETNQGDLVLIELLVRDHFVATRSLAYQDPALTPIVCLLFAAGATLKKGYDDRIYQQLSNENMYLYTGQVQNTGDKFKKWWAEYQKRLSNKNNPPSQAELVALKRLAEKANNQDLLKKITICQVTQMNLSNKGHTLPPSSLLKKPKNTPASGGGPKVLPVALGKAK